jgi:hypothetical protein
MSLVNDALKRANRSLKQPTASGQPTVGLRPAPGPEGPGMLRMILVPLLIVGFVGALGLFWWQWQHGQSKPTGEAARIAAVTPTPVPHTATPAVPEAPPVTAAPKPAPAVERTTLGTPAQAGAIPPSSIAAAAHAKPAAAPAAVAKSAPPPALAPNAVAPTFPPIRIQAIYFRLSGPSAMVNGQTVFVGSEVSGAKVVKIERQSITFEMEGLRKTFDMFLR